MEKELIIISAVWCPSCLVLNKNIKELKKNYPNLKITKLDYDLDEEEVIHYSVGKILPVLITKIDNKETNRLIGEKKYKEIEEFLKKEKLI